MAHKEHTKIRQMIMEMGESLGFDAIGKTMRRLYQLASADCVWYYPKESDPESI